MAYRKAWEVAWRRERNAGLPGRYVPADGARERLQQLRDAHVPIRALARGTGLSSAAIEGILNGDRNYVQRRTAECVDRLSLSTVYGEQAKGHVPRIGAQRRIQALMSIGWTHEALAAAGAPGTARVLSAQGHLMTATRWREVRDVYDQLSMTSGPSALTRGWSRSLGYAPPLAWDDETIDDPTAAPQGAGEKDNSDERVVDLVAVRRVVEGGSPEGVALTRVERLIATRMLAAAGASDAEIAERVGVSSRTVLRARKAAEIPPGRPRSQETTRTKWAEAAAASRSGVRRPEPHSPIADRTVGLPR